MKNYNFMWGQKQSAMISEMMFYNLGPERRLFNSEIREDLVVLIDGILGNYMPDVALEGWRKNGNKYFDKGFTKNLFRDMEKFIKDFYKFCDDLKQKDLAGLSNSEIKKMVVKYRYFIKKALAYFGASTPNATYQLEEKIKKILKGKIKNNKLLKEYFIDLSTPAELDETMKERIDFLKLTQKKVVLEKDLENHSRTYPALFFNTYSKKEVINFLQKRLSEERKSKTTKEEIKKMKDNLKIMAKKHKEIYSKIGSKQLEYCAKVLQKSGLVRWRLKHVWSGAEYLCLNLIHELKKRINVGFDDFIKTYLFSDILNFLDSKEKLSNKAIKDRKVCIVMHYFNGKTKFYFGNEGLAYKNKLIKPKEEKELYSENVRGMAANKGFIRGIARVINVRNLKQFLKDNKAFKKGEILVTTMTSPIMVPIIAKASGIITDEGGITSHAAVVSREFKIPCIVGTHGASSIIKTGDLVELDGDKGTVRVVS